MTSPKKITASPKKITASPKKITASPKKNKASPKKNKAYPKKNKASLKKIMVSPKKTKSPVKLKTKSPVKLKNIVERLTRVAEDKQSTITNELTKQSVTIIKKKCGVCVNCVGTVFTAMIWRNMEALES